MRLLNRARSSLSEQGTQSKEIEKTISDLYNKISTDEKIVTNN